MGMTDEHWCSDCKRSLDKTKDKYVEAEFPNERDPKRTNRVFLCQPCARKSKVTVGGQKVSVWALLKRLRQRGNPTFEVGIHCYAAPVCETHEPRKGRVNCAHVAVTPEGRVYCKRNHPGFVILPQEKSVAEQSKFENILGYVKRMGKAAGVSQLRTILRAYGLDPANAKTATQVAPLGGDVTATSAKALEKAMEETRKRLMGIGKRTSSPGEGVAK